MPTRTLSFLLLIAAFFAAAPALALTGAAPSEAQLKQPAIPPSEDPVPTAAVEQPAVTTPANGGPAKTASNRSSGTDPCPLPKETASSSPDDLAKVQEEIDRFTLCVQRAQLLERLNDSAIKNQMSDDVALGYTPPPMQGGSGPNMMPGLAGAQRAGVGGMGLSPLPANALGGIDVAPRNSGSAAVPKSIGAATQVSEDDEPAKPEIAKEWTIHEVSAAGGEMQAKLLSPEGDEVKAKSGMKLPDGKVVVRITPTGVSLRDAKGVKALEWSRS